MENYLKQIANEIYNLAQPRPFDYLLLIVSIVGVCISGVAIFYAIKVPQKIAERQSKIDLFELRYEIYDEINSWMMCVYNFFKYRGEDDSIALDLLFKECFRMKYDSQSFNGLNLKVSVLQDRCNLLFNDIDSEIFMKAIGNLSEILNEETELDLEDIESKWLNNQKEVDENLKIMREQLKQYN